MAKINIIFEKLEMIFFKVQKILLSYTEIVIDILNLKHFISEKVINLTI